MTKPSIRLDLNWLLVPLLAVAAIAPLTFPGYFEAQSGFLPAFKAQTPAAMPEWARIAPPLQAEGVLPYYLVWPWLRLFGDAVIALKWGFGLSLLLGALGVYAWLRRRLGAPGGLLAATVYTYLPLHLGAVYVRGAPAEAWLWTLWPWIFWGAERLGRGQRTRSVGLAIGLPLLAATFFLQPGLALLGTVILITCLLTIVGDPARLRLRLAVALPLLLLLLALLARTMPGPPEDFSRGFLRLHQLFSAAWAGDASLQLGLVAAGLSLVTLALWPGHMHRPGSASSAVSSPALGFWLAVLLLLVLLSLPLAGWFWRFTGYDRLVSHPWQVLSLAGLPLAFLAGHVIRLEPRLGEPAAVAGLVALVILSGYPALDPPFTETGPGPQPLAVLEQAGTHTPQILLLDAEVGTTAEVTSTLALTLTWQALTPVDKDYTAFIHLLSADGSKLGQRDAHPCDGQCPTHTWQPGSIIVDAHPLPGPTGAARLAVGLYLLETGDRVPVVGRDDGMVIIDVR